MLGMIREVVATLRVASQSGREEHKARTFAKRPESFAGGAGKMLDVRDSRDEWVVGRQRKPGHDISLGL